MALVIGMGEYQHLASLNNPVPDAKAVAASLKAHGFEVSEHYNLDRAPTCSTCWRSSSARRKARKWRSSIMPATAWRSRARTCWRRPTWRSTARTRSRSEASSSIKLFSAASPAPHQIVLLDACRNNPFPQCPTRGAGEGTGFRGFSRITEEDRSLLIANATLSGKLAADGDAGAHSPFAQSLLKNIEEHPQRYSSAICSTRRPKMCASPRAAAQVPEITTRGGARANICLDPSGCGEGGGTLSPEGALTDSGVDRRGAKHAAATRLSQRYDAGRGHEDLLADAIKRFQAKAGLEAGRARSRRRCLRCCARPKLPGFQFRESRCCTPVAPSATEHEAGSNFKDCESCPDMVAVPAGRFVMGAAKAEKGQAEGRGAAA